MLRLSHNDGETFMVREAAEAAAAVDAQLRREEQFRRLGAELRKRSPSLVVTCARGSSDHAATYAKYLIESRAHAICASAAPSISSVYASPLPARGAVCLAISQSGQSPDLVCAVENLKMGGAFVIALVNAEESPLSRLADKTIALEAGREQSVAATKSFIASLSAIAALIAHWTEDDDLLAALRALPRQLEAAFALDWSPAARALEKTQCLYVLGRGLGFAVAGEAALKFKETCSLHGEAFSAAEALHGPAALITRGFPVFTFALNDETLAGVNRTLALLAARGAALISAGAEAPGGLRLPTIDAHPALQPMLLIESFYRFANSLSLLRGFDPDRPPNLSKVTETI